MTLRVGRVVLLPLLCASAVLAAACGGPPPALPTAVLAQGIEAVPEEHPEMTEQQLERCGDCHKASDAPAQ